jgi:WD40 repeat protein
VFVSYNWSDGADLAASIRTRLEREGIPLWQDRVALEGGRDWWLQVTDALDHVEFMVLVMTPKALQSEMVRKEWRYARQRGVCVYPVKSTVELDFASLPRWMRGAHFYDVDRDWTKFTNDLNSKCVSPRVAFMVEDLPDGYVPRPREFEALVAQLVNAQGGEPIAIAAALRGAGGYGKTTLAKAVCHDERVQEAFDDGILWVTLGEHPGDLRGRVGDLIEALSGERPGFEGIDAARARLVELLADRDTLIVVDDVWNRAHLKPFLDGGPRCARLITTRNLDTLPANARTVNVDQMQEEEALASLSTGLSAGHRGDFAALVRRLGAWPLLLKLANGALRERVNAGENLRDAFAYVNRALDRRGLVAFDARDAAAREQAVANTIGVSIDLLTTGDRARYVELAVFPEDTNIPLATVARLWAGTAELDEFDAEELLSRLNRLSLLLQLDLTTRQLRMHDVMRQYLVRQCGTKLPSLHAVLLDALRPRSGTWADLLEHPYAWDNLAYHLRAASRGDELVETVKDLRYLAAKAHVRGSILAENDIAAAQKHAGDDAILRLLRRGFAQARHILNACGDLEETQATLYSRLQHVSNLAALTETLAAVLKPPHVTPWHRLPDAPHPALLRTLAGHSASVNGCAVSPDGTLIASASADGTVKVWDVAAGNERLTLVGHAQAVENCAFSPDGTLIASASADRTIKLWDSQSGAERITLSGHTDRIQACAFHPDGASIVSASADHTLKIWDVSTGKVRLTLVGHAASVESCAFSPDGASIVSASWDRSVKVWDARTGDERATLSGHTGAVNGCAISPNGERILSASSDRTLRLWDSKTGAARLILQGHHDPVNTCAVSPDGAVLVSGSSDYNLKTWDERLGTERLTLDGHTGRVQGCAFSGDGALLVSASIDRTVKMWDARSSEQRLVAGHTRSVNCCAVSPDGSLIVSGSSDWTLKVWDAATGTELRTLFGHTGLVQGCAFSPDGALILSAAEDASLKVWDVRTGEELLTLAGHTDRVEACAFSPDGSRVLSASWDHTLKLWDAQTGMEMMTLLGHDDEVQGCAFSPDGASIVSASWDGTLRLWDAHTGAVRSTLAATSRLAISCAFSPDGEYVVSSSSDGNLKVWDARTGIKRVTMTGHASLIDGCAFSPDCRTVVSASLDARLKLWDAASGQCLTTFYADAELRDCAWFPDGKHLAVVGDGGTYFLRVVV